MIVENSRFQVVRRLVSPPEIVQKETMVEWENEWEKELQIYGIGRKSLKAHASRRQESKCEMSIRII